MNEEIKSLREELEQSAALIRTLREENAQLDQVTTVHLALSHYHHLIIQSSVDLVTQLQNAVLLSQSLNDECERLRKKHAGIDEGALESNALVAELETSIAEKNRSLLALETLLGQSKTAHTRSLEHIRMLDDKLQVLCLQGFMYS